MDTLDIITAGALASLALELIKWTIRKVKKEDTYDFSKSFYGVMLPILTFAAQPLLALLNVSEYVFPNDWLSWVQQLIVVALSSLASVILYTVGVKPLKNYIPDNS